MFSKVVILKHRDPEEGKKWSRLNSDSKWGGRKHFFLSNPLEFPKMWGRGAEAPPPAYPPPRALE